MELNKPIGYEKVWLIYKRFSCWKELIHGLGLSSEARWSTFLLILIWIIWNLFNHHRLFSKKYGLLSFLLSFCSSDFKFFLFLLLNGLEFDPSSVLDECFEFFHHLCLSFFCLDGIFNLLFFRFLLLELLIQNSILFGFSLHLEVSFLLVSLIFSIIELGLFSINSVLDFFLSSFMLDSFFFKSIFFSHQVFIMVSSLIGHNFD